MLNNQHDDNYRPLYRISHPRYIMASPNQQNLIRIHSSYLGRLQSERAKWKTGLQERSLVLWTSTEIRKENKKRKLAQVPSTELRWSWVLWKVLSNPACGNPSLKSSRRWESKLIRYLGHWIWGKWHLSHCHSEFPIVSLWKGHIRFLIIIHEKQQFRGFFLLCFLLSSDNKWKTKACWKSGTCWGCLKYHTHRCSNLHWEQSRVACPSLKPHIHILSLIIMSVLIMIYSKNHAKCAIPRGSNVRWQPPKWLFLNEVKRLPLPTLALKCKAECTWSQQEMCNPLATASVRQGQSATLSKFLWVAWVPSWECPEVTHPSPVPASPAAPRQHPLPEAGFLQ